jgi:hypothetical protein
VCVCRTGRQLIARKDARGITSTKLSGAAVCFSYTGSVEVLFLFSGSSFRAARATRSWVSSLRLIRHPEKSWRATIRTTLDARSSLRTKKPEPSTTKLHLCDCPIRPDFNKIICGKREIYAGIKELPQCLKTKYWRADWTGWNAAIYGDGWRGRLRPQPRSNDLPAIPEEKRVRDLAHLAFVASQPCLICGAPASGGAFASRNYSRDAQMADASRRSLQQSFRSPY